jgi:hypothetical protein
MPDVDEDGIRWDHRPPNHLNVDVYSHIEKAMFFAQLDKLLPLYNVRMMRDFDKALTDGGNDVSFCVLVRVSYYFCNFFNHFFKVLRFCLVP